MKCNQIYRLSILSLLVSGFLILGTCHKDEITTPSESEEALVLKKKGDDCGTDIDVRGTGSSKKEAKKDLKNKAVSSCYNVCKNGPCTTGGCAYKKTKVGTISTSVNANGEHVAEATVECSCKCEDCDGKKIVVVPAFSGSGASEEEAITDAKNMADEYCKNVECVRFACDDPEEVCQFVEAITSKPETEGEGEAWTAEVVLEKCDCECGVPDPSE